MSKAYVKILSKQDGKTLQDLDHANDLIVKKKTKHVINGFFLTQVFQWLARCVLFKCQKKMVRERIFPSNSYICWDFLFW